MKQIYTKLILAVSLVLVFSLNVRAVNLLPQSSTNGTVAEEAVLSIETPALFINLSEGGIDAYPLSTINDYYKNEDNTLVLELTSGYIIEYTTNEYTSYSTEVPQLPTLTSFAFSRDYNHNLFADVAATAITNNISMVASALGKSLTAGFELSDANAFAYVNGELQISNHSRADYSSPIDFVVTYGNYNVVTYEKIKEEIWQETATEMSKIELTAADLSTNKPSQYASESVASLLDNDASTIFHSTWGSANDATIDVDTYIDIVLPSAVEKICIYYKCRPQTGYNPRVWEVYASNDGDDWTLVRTLNYETDNMPQGGLSQEYTSPVINLGDSYSYIRILQTDGEYAKNHFAIAELALYNVTKVGGESIKIQDAEYDYIKTPFGRVYNIDVNSLTSNGNVPRIDIDIVDNAEVVEKDTYLDANFRITGNGVFEDFEDSVTIKGRGNSTWGYPKKPYRLKFGSKVKPFGLKKGKSWVLLANYQTGSLLANAIAMKAGKLAEVPYTNDIIPVELYINGTYRGSYMFTQHVSISGNSVDEDDEVAYRLELDTYYDETYRFRSSIYNLPVNFKDPDLDDYEDETERTAKYNAIVDDFNNLESIIYSNGNISSVLDVDNSARFMFVNELVMNQELGHPKSVFLWRGDITSPDSKITFGPLWDFDWGFGYETTGNYCTIAYDNDYYNSGMPNSGNGRTFFTTLINNDEFKCSYYKVCKEFFNSGRVDELNEYIASYFEYAEESFINNSTKWSDGANYGSQIERMQNWLKNRVEYMYNKTEPMYNLAVSVAGYATIYLGFDAIIPEGIEVFTISEVEGEWAKLQPVTGVLPAHTGAIVKANEGNYIFKETDYTASIENNMLDGSDEDLHLIPENETKYYVLSMVDGVVGLYPDALKNGVFKNNAYKSYMPLNIADTNNAALSNGFRFDFSGTTMVDAIKAESPANNTIYDLCGRKINNPTQGIYIVNGKKVSVK